MYSLRISIAPASEKGAVESTGIEVSSSPIERRNSVLAADRSPRLLMPCRSIGTIHAPLAFLFGEVVRNPLLQVFNGAVQVALFGVVAQVFRFRVIAEI